MTDNMVLLANRDLQPSCDSDLAAAFIMTSKAKGYAFNTLETNFSMAGRGVASDAYWHHAGQQSNDLRNLMPLDKDAGALVVASPMHWFGLSIKQRTAIDTICDRFFMNIDYSQAIKKCALIVCSNMKECDAIHALYDTLVETCYCHGVVDCGLLTIVTL